MTQTQAQINEAVYALLNRTEIVTAKALNGFVYLKSISMTESALKTRLGLPIAKIRTAIEQLTAEGRVVAIGYSITAASGKRQNIYASVEAERIATEHNKGDQR